jgi:hypothetical protein
MTIALAAGDLNQFRGDFGEVWVEAVCLAGGFTPNRSTRDRRGQDFIVQDEAAEIVRVQVKSTESPTYVGSDLCVDLDIATYDRLRVGTTPGIIVHVVVSKPYPDWLNQGRMKALVRAHAYWKSLSGMPNTSNSTTITIHIPQTNVFRPDTVRTLFP